MPPAASSNDSLPDELLLHILSSLPCLTAWQLDGALTLGSLGAPERTCRRWRRLALGLAGQHPVHIWCLKAAFGANTCSPAVSREFAHCLDARSPAVVTLNQPTGAVAALLLGLRLPAVRRLTVKRWDLGAVLPSLPHTFPALEELHTTGSHDQAFPAALRLLPGLTAVDIAVSVITADLVAALLALPQLQNVRLTLRGPLPGSATWQQLGQLGPRLRHLSLTMDNPGEQLPAELFEVPSTVELVLYARQHGGELEGPQRLSSLRRLELELAGPEGDPVPSSCWACSHLTALCLSYFLPEVPAGVGATLSTLRRLELAYMDLHADGFPAEFCKLPQLTGVMLLEVEIGDICLPPGMSKLSKLEELSFKNPTGSLEAEGLAVLRLMTSHTHLELIECPVEGVPGEPIFPPSLQQLTISEEGAEAMCTLLSPALFVSPSLRRLHLTLAGQAVTEQARWWRLAAVLRGHPSLQELHVELRDEDWSAMTPAEERRVWFQLQQKLRAAGVTAGLRHLVGE